MGSKRRGLEDFFADSLALFVLLVFFEIANKRFQKKPKNDGKYQKETDKKYFVLIFFSLHNFILIYFRQNPDSLSRNRPYPFHFFVRVDLSSRQSGPASPEHPHSDYIL